MNGYNETRAALGWPLSAERGTVSAVDAEGFSREVVFEPGHPLTVGSGPSTNYGRSSLTIRFLLHGPRGTIQFLWSTGVTPEKVYEARRGYTHDEWMHEEWMHHAPMGFDVGYHADSPNYDSQSEFECQYRPAGVCFYDGSGLAGTSMLELFLTKGEDAMWAELRERYTQWIDGVES